MEPRGYRNNNPLNIKRGILWKGLSPLQTDETFCQFESMYFGFRAALICICRTYYLRGWRSLGHIVRNWAPQPENDTEAYIRAVCLRTGYEAAEKLPRPTMGTKKVWMGVIKAMTYVENGKWEPEYYHDLSEAYNEIFCKIKD